MRVTRLTNLTIRDLIILSLGFDDYDNYVYVSDLG
jgi:hypothetical protein